MTHQHTILPSDQGRIKKVLIQSAMSGAVSEEDLLTVHKGLFHAFVEHGDEDIEICLVSQKDFDLPELRPLAQYWDAVQAMLHEADPIIPSGVNAQPKAMKDHVRLLNPNFDLARYLHGWKDAGLVSSSRISDAHVFFLFIQDPVVPMRNEVNMPILLEPYYAWSKHRGDDPVRVTAGSDVLLSKFVPEILSSFGLTLSKSTPWFFQGGNVLSSGDFAFLGEDILLKNLHEYAGNLLPKNDDGLFQAAVQEFNDRIAETLGVSQVIYPGLPQLHTPLLHAITQPKTLYHMDLWLTCGGTVGKGSHLVLVGKLHDYDARDAQWIPVPSGDPDQDYLDAAATYLEHYSEGGLTFEVRRLPLLRVDGHLLSYNNCIVETYGAAKQVFMPVFADYLGTDTLPNEKFRVADAMATAIFEDCGLKVRGIDFGMRTLASLKAGLHCKVLVLARD